MKARLAGALLVLATWLVAVCLAAGAREALLEAAAQPPMRAIALLAGIASGVVLLLLAQRVAPASTRFWTTTDHELTHAIAAVLTGSKPRDLHVGHHGHGLFVHSHTRWVWAIALAPYVLPTSTIALALVSLAVPGPVPPTLLGIIGLTLGYHLATDVAEARPRQPDIREHGGWVALCGIAGVWSCTLLLAIGSVTLGAIPLLRAAVGWLRHVASA